MAHFGAPKKEARLEPFLDILSWADREDGAAQERRRRRAQTRGPLHDSGPQVLACCAAAPLVVVGRGSPLSRSAPTGSVRSAALTPLPAGMGWNMASRFAPRTRSSWPRSSRTTSRSRITSWGSSRFALCPSPRGRSQTGVMRKEVHPTLGEIEEGATCRQPQHPTLPRRCALGRRGAFTACFHTPHRLCAAPPSGPVISRITHVRGWAMAADEFRARAQPGSLRPHLQGHHLPGASSSPPIPAISWRPCCGRRGVSPQLADERATARCGVARSHSVEIHT